jgi:putative transposase
VRRVLAKYYRADHGGSDGPSWLTFIGHIKDSVWSVDLFRCESVLLRSHWVMLVMDVFTRRIIGFGIAPAYIDGVSVCRMFNHAIAGQQLPRHLSTDHDPLFRFHRWLANLRVLDIEEIKSIPYVPVSHPFVERLIGTIRREYLDWMLFWNAVDLARKLEEFRTYYKREPSPSVTRRRHAVGKIWRASATARFARSLRLAVTLPRTISDTNGGLKCQFASDRFKTEA